MLLLRLYCTVAKRSDRGGTRHNSVFRCLPVLWWSYLLPGIWVSRKTTSRCLSTSTQVSRVTPDLPQPAPAIKLQVPLYCHPNVRRKVPTLLCSQPLQVPSVRLQGVHTNHPRHHARTDIGHAPRSRDCSPHLREQAWSALCEAGFAHVRRKQLHATPGFQAPRIDTVKMHRHEERHRHRHRHGPG